MIKNIDRIEAHLREIFEGKLIQIFTGKHQPAHLIEALVDSMQDNLQPTQDGATIAPDLYTIQVSPEDLDDWQSHQDLLDDIAASLFQIGRLEGFVFHNTPAVILNSNPDISRRDFFITAQVKAKSPILPDTSALVAADIQEQRDSLPKEAYFVIGGSAHFALNKPVINIGRHSDNDLILDEAHISRHHAQMRAINQRFVIFDVGSMGGVFLNGRKITQASLHTGDVVRIGPVNLIYIQEQTTTNQTMAISADEDHHINSKEITGGNQD